MHTTPHERIHQTLAHRTAKVLLNPTRSVLIDNAIRQRDAIRLENGTLVTWTPQESTGRSPKDTLIVKRAKSESTIDWSSSYSVPVDEETFDMILRDVMHSLEMKDRLYVQEKAIGADPSYSLPVVSIVDNALAGLFIDNMFREEPEGIESSCFKDKPFYLLVNQHDKLDPQRYEGRLRSLPDGTTSTMAVVMDLDRRIGIVFGSAYMGSMKKLMFTVMNYYLPDEQVLPLHCSANEGKNGDIAIFLGLSGTGKTTLSTTDDRALLGDDEHGWNETGIANFENGCYAKLFQLDPRKEPEVYNAVFHPDHYLNHGSLVENLMVYPTGVYDFDDDRFTQNSRASYPLRYLSNIKESSMGGHPDTVIFLTADAYGVLPPVSQLSAEQAMFWFMMGYTSKLAGTETGIVEPQSAFSRFFGAPFMVRNPKDYTDLLGEKLKHHKSRVFLVNTGWSGGAYGTGKRIDITMTRTMVQAALAGELNDVEYVTEPVFNLSFPRTCRDVPETVLNPQKGWKNESSYHAQAEKLAAEFRAHFEKEFAGKVPDSVTSQCPGY